MDIATVVFRIIFRIMLLNIPAILLFQGLACTTGLAVFAFFALSGCDPLANRDVQNPNQVHNNSICNVIMSSAKNSSLLLKDDRVQDRIATPPNMPFKLSNS